MRNVQLIARSLENSFLGCDDNRDGVKARLFEGFISWHLRPYSRVLITRVNSYVKKHSKTVFWDVITTEMTQERNYFNDLFIGIYEHLRMANLPIKCRLQIMTNSTV